MYSVITPYILPENSLKKVNIGDGIILDSGIKLLKKKPKFLFSSRKDLDEKEIKKINKTKALIVMGANILKDDFKITPNFDFETLNKIKVPLILFGIGHYGILEATKKGLNKKSIKIFNEILNRFKFVSVRCDGSFNYLSDSLNKNKKVILNTSCPSIYSLEKENKKFKIKKLKNIAVTITDRNNIDQQLKLFHFIKNNFKHFNLIAPLHQDYNNIKLENYLTNLGYKIFKSTNYKDFINMYKKIDFHIGNRLHAHLKCLSMGIISFLTPFDYRQLFFSKSLDFPLIEKLPDINIQNYNFKNFETKRKNLKKNMNLFIREIKKII